MKRGLLYFSVILLVCFFHFCIMQKDIFCLEETTKTPHQIDELIGMLADPNPKTKKLAYKEVLKIGKTAGPNLLNTAKDWKNASTDLRITCVDLMGEIKYQKSVVDLVSFLNEKSPRMRYVSATALGNIGDKSAVGPLIETLLKDTDWEVRKFTAQALGKLKDKKATEPLSNVLLNDSSEYVRLECIKALDEIQDKSCTPSIIKALKDKAPFVRAYSAELLGNWQIKEATGDIQDLLDHDRAYTVRASSAYALGKLKDRTTLPSLVNALSDEYQEVRARALDSLRKITGRDFGEDKTAWQTYITK